MLPMKCKWNQLKRLLAPLGLSLALLGLGFGFLLASASPTKANGQRMATGVVGGSLEPHEGQGASPALFPYRQNITGTIDPPPLPPPPAGLERPAGALNLGAPVIRERSDPPPLPGWAAAMRAGELQSASNAVIINQQVQTESPGGAVNGQRITYTILITSAGQALNNGTIIDILPAGALVDVNCVGSCDITSQVITGTREIFNPVTKETDIFTSVVTLPIRIDWTNVSIGANQTIARTFSGRITCQTDGARLQNSVFVQGGGSNIKETPVEVLGAESGIVSLSDGATWCSEEQDGVLDLDWGDFDLDGDLDLATAAATGIAVHRNNGGNLSLFWRDLSSRRASGIRWADVITDNSTLELIAVGDFATTAFGFQGRNYVYAQTGNDFAIARSFPDNNSEAAADILWRVAPADYDNDGDIDLAAASFIDINSLDVSRYNLCLVRLYENNSNGNFTADQCLIGGLEGSPSWESAETDRTSSLAWGDYDSDNDLDLAVGNDNNQPDRLYRNNDGDLVLEWTSAGANALNNTRSVAWGDYNADGTIDLATGNFGQRNFVFRNVRTVDQQTQAQTFALDFTPAWQSDDTRSTTGINWNTEGLDASIPAADEDQLEYLLPFNFPFFGRIIRKINVGTNGSIELLEAGEVPCTACATFFNIHVTGFHTTRESDFIYGLSEDLYTGVIIEPLPVEGPNRLEITWIGTTYTDQFRFGSTNGEMMFKVIMHDDGRVVWKFFDLFYQSRYQQTPAGDFFAGIYNANNNLEYPTGLNLAQPPLGFPPVRQRAFEFDPQTESVAGIAWDPLDQSIPPRNDNSGLIDYTPATTFTFRHNNRAITKLGVSPNGIVELLEAAETCEVCSSLYMYPYVPPTNGEFFSQAFDNDYILAANDDLSAGVLIEGSRADDRVYITWMGRTVADGFRDWEMAFKVTLLNDGGAAEDDRVRWKFFDMNYTNRAPLGFTTSGIARGPLFTLPATFGYFRGIFGGVQGLGVNRRYIFDPSVNQGEFRVEPQGPGLAAGNESQANGWYRTNAAGVLQTALDTTAWNPANTFNTQSVAWGDYDNDGNFDLAVGNLGQVNAVYQGSNNSTALTPNPIWTSNQTDQTFSVAWADYDNDGDPDLSVGNNGPNQIYANSAGTLAGDPIWTSTETDDTRSISWADYDADGDLDLAVGNFAQSNRIYRNDGGGVLTLLTTFAITDRTRAVTWGDYDNDGDPDLAVGNDGEPNYLYRNRLFFRISPTEIRRIGRINDLAWADYNNDGQLDLAIGGVDLEAPGGGFIHLFTNIGGNLNPNSLLVDTGIGGELADLAWGDYDSDGYLDLAGAFSTQKEVRVYHNENGNSFAASQTIPTGANALAVDWADFNQDGQLDLAVGDLPPKIYRLVGGSFAVDPNLTLTTAAFVGDSDVVGIRGVDHDNDGDPDITFGNLFGSTLQFSTFAPRLNATLSPASPPPAFSANSVAWGDGDNDGDQDLLFGAGSPGDVATKLYLNENGVFVNRVDLLASGLGPHTAAFGDANANGRLDIAVARESVADDAQLYLDGGTSPATGQFPFSFTTSRSLAWADSDSDGDLDLLIGNEGQNILFIRETGTFSPTFIPTPPDGLDNTYSVAWVDYDKDYDLDFAVGNLDGKVHLYRNDDNNVFTLVWSSPTNAKTRSIAWGDYDGDGYVDLAAGNYGERNVIYRNVNGTLENTPVWQSPEVRKTTSLAWGDWDNDADLDLAVGNDGEVDQVYANNGGQLRLLWASAEINRTTGVAWGDVDGDGDLDLAISQAESNKRNGFYENNYVSPSHLTNNFAQTIPLPDNPAYLAIERPGQTNDAYFYSSAEILSGPLDPTIAISYTLFDPDGTRDENIPDEPGDRVVEILYEFSLDGGGTWQPATGTPVGVPETSRLGRPGVFMWNAPADAAISDNALFRVTIIPQAQAGPVQRGATSAVSPPFRIRGLTCQWPDDAGITIIPASPDPLEKAQFIGSILAGSGVLTFSWDLGDGNSKIGQVVQHSFEKNGTYSVVLTVTGQRCPISGKTTITRLVIVGTGLPDTYLPFITKDSNTPTTVTEIDPSTVLRVQTIPGAPGQVTGLSGSSQLEAGLTQLVWQANPPEQGVRGYRVYRAETSRGVFQRLADVPAGSPAYTDNSSTCGQMYLITAYNDAGESLPSAASYFTLPCR